MTIADDVYFILGRDMTAAEETRAARLIELAGAKLQDALPGFTVTAGTETVEIQPDDPEAWWTPRYPVRALTTVTIDTQTITGLQVNKWGRIRARTSQLNEWELNLGVLTATTIALTYDYGFDPVTDDVSMTIAGMVAAAIQRAATNPGQVQSEALGSYQVSYGDWSLRQAAEGLSLPDNPLPQWKRNKALGVYLVAD